MAALYTMSEGQRPALAPLSTYTVDGATPTYLVIDGVRRAIESFTDGYEMTLAADSELMGAEMYHLFSRCPGERATGWFDLRGQGCAGGAAGGASVAIDAAGEVHLLAGSMDEGAGAGCATSPTYARFAEGCDAIGEVAAEMRSSALLAQGGVIHALIEVRSADAGFHGQIVHRWRGAADSAWEEEAVAPAGSPVREMRLLAAGRRWWRSSAERTGRSRCCAAATRARGSLRRRRWRGRCWTRTRRRTGRWLCCSRSRRRRCGCAVRW
ncbi:MAG: hypothetical protein IPK80_25750 [Nannocystis sp.]|nr:hypothetical protein [Nannocystis sp.]